MVAPAEREKLRQAKAEREAEKDRIRAAKEAARAEKELKKRQELAEKEQKKREREALEAEKELKKKEKEARKQQDEAKKQQVEAEKEHRRREKEALEAERENKRKERELKRQQDEADKEQKRKEKEAAERKKQLLLRKQANIMDRFVRRKEADTLSPQRTQCAGDNGLSPSPDQQESNSVSGTEDVMLRLDEELRSTCIITEDEVLRNHVVSWQEKWKRRSSEPFRRWGVRLTPKVTVFRELRLQGAGTGSCRKTDSTANAGSCPNSEVQALSLKRSREEDGSLDDSKLDDSTIVLEDDADAICSPPRKKHCNSRWKLLQFDKSHRPAYYGTYSKVSSAVGPRHPLRKDPSLDYEVDSDEEWEEEDPGESLSDCEDKEDEMEKVEPELDEDAADGFVVPDGYLSENEGVHLEEADMEDSQMSAECPSPGKSVSLTESSGSTDQMVRKQQHLLKLLDNVTKHALQRNRPFLVSDLLQQPGEKSTNVENQTERLCFQALRMCIVAPNILMGPAAIEV